MLTTSQPVLGRTLGQCIEGKGLVRMELMEVVSITSQTMSTVTIKDGDNIIFM